MTIDKKIVTGLENLFKSINDIEDVRSRDKIPGATYDVTFTHPESPGNKNNWVGCNYNTKDRSLVLILHGAFEELPDKIVKAIKKMFPNARYLQDTPQYYRFDGIMPNEIIDLAKTH